MKRREISVKELETKEGIKFKVTRSIPELKIAETKMVKTKEEAKELVDTWLQ